MPGTILVVDDDHALVDFVKESLEAMGHRVICGYNGQMAIRFAKLHDPDLILLDINMPLTDGFKVLEALRAAPETRPIPVILLTNMASKHLYPVLESNQRITYLKKPVDLEDLNSIIGHFLQRYSAA